LRLVALTNTQSRAGYESAFRGLSARVTPTLEVTAVTCPPEVFQRSPSATLAGPMVRAMNSAQTVVGEDLGVEGTMGLQQTADGTCTFTLAPGSTGTMFTGINDQGHIVGQYWTTAPGITRFHGFTKIGATTTPLPGGPNDALFPTAINAVGDIVGYAYRDIQPDGTSTYQAFYLPAGGAIDFLEAPTGDQLWLTGLNNVGQVVGVSAGQEGITGGQAWLYDHATDTFTELPEPTPATAWLLPHAINDHGMIVGMYSEKVNGRDVVQQFLATPATQRGPRLPRLAAWQARRHALSPRSPARRERLSTLRSQVAARATQPGAMVDTRWKPVLDDDGTVVLTDGEKVYGSRTP
jgi:hypothetical protein